MAARRDRPGEVVRTLVFLAVFGVCVLPPPGSPDCSVRQALAEDPSGIDNDERAPQYPWPAFVVFWNKRCKPGCEIRNSMELDSHYLVPFSHSVSLVVEMRQGYVSSVRAVYGDPDQREGGRHWIKLVESAITAGTFRWPEERIQEARQRFRAVSAEPASYMWRNSSFRREQAAGGWEFTLRFLPQAVY